MATPAQLQVEHSSAPGGVRTLSIAGELDIATTPQLEKEVDKALAEGAQAIVIDLAGLSFIDSTGLRMFLHLNERASSDGWRLTLARPSHQVEKILRVTGNSKRAADRRDLDGDRRASGLERSARTAYGAAAAAYQACVVPQCGQVTLVETGAMKK